MAFNFNSHEFFLLFFLHLVPMRKCSLILSHKPTESIALALIRMKPCMCAPWHEAQIATTVVLLVAIDMMHNKAGHIFLAFCFRKGKLLHDRQKHCAMLSHALAVVSARFIFRFWFHFIILTANTIRLTTAEIKITIVAVNVHLAFLFLSKLSFCARHPSCTRGWASAFYAVVSAPCTFHG